MSRKIALITGAGGQDGSYLSELLLAKDYIVHGLLRHCSVSNNERVCHLEGNPNFHVHYGDMTQAISLITELKPDEVYNLAAQSFVKVSFDIPVYTCDVNGIAVLKMLETIKHTNPKTKFYQASTSELFGDTPAPQSEESPFRPRSPYAISKLLAYWLVTNYREAYNLFAVNGILFNHESPRRGECFVTKKICRGVADIDRGTINHIELGNLNSKRDWGHARDYVECMWRMMQHSVPDDFVISTGCSYTVRQFVVEAFSKIGMSISFQGQGLEEVGYDQDGIIRVKINPIFFRPTEVEDLQGDSSKARCLLNWKPKNTFQDLVEEMMTVELMPLAG